MSRDYTPRSALVGFLLRRFWGPNLARLLFSHISIRRKDVRFTLLDETAGLSLRTILDISLIGSQIRLTAGQHILSIETTILQSRF